ncbi:MAG: type II toxin-antitoxin system prevent-host-death family antitoxin [Spirochaetes bacterium]|nr:MAG: type II toxin-antitoxin system prevent-host-death family antitoxin [Spirochaetota bacterium]
MQIAAGKFKAECLKLMDVVNQTKEDIIVTKHGKPVAKLVAFRNSEATPVFGFLKGTISKQGDIISPINEHWEADA